MGSVMVCARAWDATVARTPAMEIVVGVSRMASAAIGQMPMAQELPG